jgi:hypothetical protein
VTESRELMVTCQKTSSFSLTEIDNAFDRTTTLVSTYRPPLVACFFVRGRMSGMKHEHQVASVMVIVGGVVTAFGIACLFSNAPGWQWKPFVFFTVGPVLIVLWIVRILK